MHRSLQQTTLSRLDCYKLFQKIILKVDSSILKGSNAKPNYS